MEQHEITYTGTVYPWHCDHMGHMNVMWYVGKFDEGTWTFFTRLGLTPAYLRETSRGMAAVEQKLQYKKELLAGDIVFVRTRLLEIKPKSIRFLHEMYREEGQDLSATCELTGVFIDTNERRSTQLPDIIVQRAKEFLVE